MSNEFECWRPGERHAFDNKSSPSAVHRVGPKGFLVQHSLETDFPKLSATFADHLGESQFCPGKDQKSSAEATQDTHNRPRGESRDQPASV